MQGQSLCRAGHHFTGLAVAQTGFNRRFTSDGPAYIDRLQEPKAAIYLNKRVETIVVAFGAPATAEMRSKTSK